MSKKTKGPAEVSVCHVENAARGGVPTHATPEPKSLDATDCFAFCCCRLGRRASFSIGRTRAPGAARP